MREFIFTIEYDSGVDPVMDVFIAQPSLKAQSISCHISTTGLWRLDRIVGPKDALSKLDSVVMDTAHCNECLGPQQCETNWEYELLIERPTCRLLYTYSPATTSCRSVPRLARDCLGAGLVCDAARYGDQYEWRLLVRDAAPVGEYYETVQAVLRDGLTSTFEQVGTPTYWTDEAATIADLPSEQRVAIETALENGYYRTPRSVSLTDLATAMGLPTSTLQYRLQRAEAWIVQKFASQPLSRRQ